MPIVRELIVDQFGVHLTKYSERLVVSRKGQKLQQVPLLHLESVLIASPGVSLSSSAISACCERGIPIHFLSPIGEPVAALYSAGLSGTVLTRRGQVAAYDDGRGILLAIAMAQGKIRNQAGLLRYAARNRKDKEPDTAARLTDLAGQVEDHSLELARLADKATPQPEDDADDDNPLDALRSQILSAEGRAAKYYWEGIGLLLDQKHGWPGRKGRGAQDPVNACLNYGYGVLYSQVERALVLAGLDPYAGFLHADRPGKPSMVLDLIEEFRPLAVDRTVVAVFNRNMPIAQGQDGLLDDDSRRTVAEAVLRRLAADAPYEDKRISLGAVIQSQARRVAAYLRRERETYEPYVMKL